MSDHTKDLFAHGIAVLILDKPDVRGTYAGFYGAYLRGDLHRVRVEKGRTLYAYKWHLRDVGPDGSPIKRGRDV